MAHRLQVWLTDRQYEALDTEANRTSVAMAELVRRLVDREFLPNTRPRLSGLEVSVGVWRRPDAAVVGRRPGIKLRD